MKYDTSRFLIDEGPGADTFYVYGPRGAQEFRTRGINGQSATGTMERNITDLTDFAPGLFILVRISGTGASAFEVVGTAQMGIFTPVDAEVTA